MRRLHSPRQWIEFHASWLFLGEIMTLYSVPSHAVCFDARDSNSSGVQGQLPVHQMVVSWAHTSPGAPGTLTLPRVFT